MAYNKAVTPWHGLGFPVDNTLSPLEMMEAAKVDWEVTKIPAVSLINGVYTDTGHSSLVRTSDNSILDVISNDWNPTQNIEAFEFFSEFVDAGHMQMETAGSLDKGRVVWALAKIGTSFEAVRDDVISGYLLFSNPHKYGRAITVRFTPIRVVCHNTLSFALDGKVGENKSVSVNHRNVFNPAEVKKTLKIAEWKMDEYKERAAFLSSKKFDMASVHEYLKQVFPAVSIRKDETEKAKALGELSKPANKVLEVLETQPGAEYGRGTFWQLFNAVTYTTDHLLGRSQDTRLHSAWFGINQSRKQLALNKAIQYAEAA